LGGGITLTQCRGDGATRPYSKDGGADERHGDLKSGYAPASRRLSTLG